MLIRISDISYEGLHIEDSIPATALNARMNEGSCNDIVFVDDPKVKIAIYKTAGGGAETKGTVSATLRQVCGLCCDPIERSLTLSTNFVLREKPTQKPGHEPKADFLLADQFIDDVGLFYYENDHFELEGAIQEVLILALSPFWHPERSAAGDCSLCKKNPLPQGTKKGRGLNSFGELLAQAGVGQKKNVH